MLQFQISLIDIQIVRIKPDNADIPIGQFIFFNFVSYFQITKQENLHLKRWAELKKVYRF